MVWLHDYVRTEFTHRRSENAIDANTAYKHKRGDKLTSFLAVAPDGALWASGWEGRQDSWFVAHFDGVQWTIYNTSEQFQTTVGRLVVTPDGAVWGATWDQGVPRFDGHEWMRFGVDQGLPSTRILGLEVAPDGALWAITDGGVVRFNGELWQLVEAPTPMTVMAFAADGSIWYGRDASVARWQP